MNKKHHQDQQKKKKAIEKAYKEMADQVEPKKPLVRNLVAAFMVGGIICAIAQALNNLFQQYGLSAQQAGTSTVILMIFLGAFLTGLGVYDNIGKFAGAGSIIPITGFSNAIVASAMEWKREGYIFGVGAKMFLIAGPVLVYGFITSVIIGLIYYFIR